jgi:hypothetical protein
MGRLLFILLLLVVVVAVLGFYLDWFDFSTSRTPDGQVDINLRIDPKRIESDAEKARDKVKGVFQRGDKEPEEK